MKPIRLEIEGLKSYIEKQVIDFDCILKEGFFGIFGKTGAGKSTILDGITLALYGRTQKGKQESTDFINTNLLKATVDFTFEIMFEGKRNKFRAYREFTLNKERKAKQPNAKLYIIKEDGTNMIEEGALKVNSKLLSIIGLSFEDFVKCIALPQGEFDSFIKEQRTNRLDIIARLFSLEKYGYKLSEKAKNLYVKYKELFEKENAKLSVLEEYTIDKITEYEKQLSDINKSYENLKTEEEHLEKELLIESEIIKNFKELSENKIALEKINTNEANILKLKEKVSKYKDANELLELYKEQEENQSKLFKEKEKLFKLNKTLNDIESLKIKEENEKFLLIYESEFEKLNSVSNELNTLKTYMERKEEIFSEIQKKREEYKNITKNILEKESIKKEIESNKAKAKSIFDSIVEEDVFKIVTKKIENNTINKEYSFLKQELDIRAKNSDFDWLNSIIKNKLLFASSETEIGDITEIIEKEKKNKQQKEELLNKINIFDKDIVLILEKIQNFNNQQSKILNEGKELNEKIEKINNVLESSLNGEDYYKKCSYVKEKLRKLKEDKIKKEAENLSIKNNYDKVNSEIIATNANIKNLSDFFDNISKKIAEKTEKCDIIDKSVALDFSMNLNDAQNAETKIRKFENEKEHVLINIKTLEELLNGKTYDKELFDKNSLRFNQLKIQINEFIEKRAVFENIISENKKKLKEKEEISVKEKEYLDMFSISDKLLNIFSKRQFLEFVAEEYLKEIAISASYTLLELTSGHYSLSYDKEFYAIDNKNGGALRKINTLSGGETFLVSLSLAFALSVAIYNKSNKHIEFFFLDEGFGSLDEELISITLDSLDKLKSKNLSIGIISHVKEMEERINSKIIIESASELEGSKIKLIY